MNYTGEVFEKVDSLMGELTVDTGVSYYECSLTVAGKKVLEFLLPLDTDSNAIVSRTQNIINQMGITQSNVRVELAEVT